VEKSRIVLIQPAAASAVAMPRSARIGKKAGCVMFVLCVIVIASPELTITDMNVMRIGVLVSSRAKKPGFSALIITKPGSP
jgi:hypothetical protein